MYNVQVFGDIDSTGKTSALFTCPVGHQYARRMLITGKAGEFPWQVEVCQVCGCLFQPKHM